MAEQGWVALLRGINLGSRNAVPMAGLREVFEAAGCSAVSTYIRSGNVLFRKRARDRSDLTEQLEEDVAEAFGVSAIVVLRTFQEIAGIAGSHPFGSDTSHSLVAFLAEKPAQKNVRELAKLDVAPDRFHALGSEVYLHYPNGIQGARLSAAVLERRLGVRATVRNWRTVKRLAAMAEAAD
jgi:uncharacterized protein (DUF1697 family)